jgi:hypothetical protein
MRVARFFRGRHFIRQTLSLTGASMITLETRRGVGNPRANESIKMEGHTTGDAWAGRMVRPGEGTEDWHLSGGNSDVEERNEEDWDPGEACRKNRTRAGALGRGSPNDET